MALEFKLPQVYKTKINKHMLDVFKYKNVNAIPKIEKVVVNCGVGDATKDAKLIEVSFNELQNITGQKPVMTKSKKAIATFKLRENQPIGVKVILRNNNMWNFICKLINVALPRVRDFKGFSKKSCDGHGNFTIGVKEQIIFTEVNYDQVKKIRGFDITFVTTAKKNEEVVELMKAISLPFNKKEK